MSFGVDYAFSPHPPVSALRKAGVKFVCRYVSNNPANDTNGKNLTPAEARALKAAGIGVVVVVEYYAQRMLEGYARGRADALHADAVVKALGMPGLPIYFAADWDATPAQQSAIDTYLDGAASAIGRARVGVYGGYYVVKRCLDAGKAHYAWQTYAWSGGQWDSRAQLRQYRNGVSLSGASVDYNATEHADYGQWPRPKAPAPKPAPAPAPAPSGPVRHVAGGHDSINDVAKNHKTGVEQIVDLSFAQMNETHQLALAKYLAFPGRDKPMPAGLVYWTAE